MNEEGKNTGAGKGATASPLCILVSHLQDFRIPLEQIVFLNWAVSCSVSFAFKPFYHSRESIMRETKLTRWAIQAARDAFKAQGILNFAPISCKSTVGGGQIIAGSKLTYYEINFERLREYLPMLIDKDAAPEYFKKWDAFCKQCARKEAPIKRANAWMEEAEALFNALEKTYNERIESYNEKAEAGECRPKTSLARSQQRLERLYNLVKAQGQRGVRNAFVAFADNLLKNGSGRGLRSPLDYFLKQDGGKWPTFEYWLNYYNSNYIIAD